MAGEDRWTSPDRTSALDRCARRNAQGIHCTLDILGRYSIDADQAQESVRALADCGREIARRGLDASLSVKLSTLGASFDRELCLRNLRSLATTRGNGGAAVELDMEGRGLVGFTLGMAVALGRERKDLTVTLQAYLDRTSGDIDRMVENGIRVRLVKGAYLGDTGDFAEIQRRMKRLARKLLGSGARFCVGAHDPDLIRWLEENADRERLQLGFLMGLADETKLRLARDGWDVIEYVPFGKSGAAYIARRQKYLVSLDALGRKPAP